MVTQAELIALISERPQNFVWFLGAGTSRMAGLPTATDVIWDLKLRHYAREENRELSKQDAQSEAIRQRVQSYMDAQGFPALWAAEEYTTYFEKIFGDDHERQRRYLKGKLAEDKITLTAGPRVLAALMKMGACHAAFTTNFDTVIEKAYADVSSGSIAAYHIEGSPSAVQAFRNQEFPFYCKLHGDFRYESVKNLAEDLTKQNEELSTCFLDAADRYGFVVAGYSGRDESVMALFRKALDARAPFPHGLFWTGVRGTPVNPAVTALLELAERKGVNCNYVEIDTFDTFMLRLWRQLPFRPKELDAKVRRSQFDHVSIDLPKPGTKTPFIRMNALRITRLPERCNALTLTKPLDWDGVRQASKDGKGNLVLTKGDKVLAWGRKLALERTLGASLLKTEVHQLPSSIDGPESFRLKRFLAEGFCFAVSRRRPLITRLRSNRTFLIVNERLADNPALAPLREAVGGALAGTVPNLTVPIGPDSLEKRQVNWSEAVQVSIEQKNGRTWLLLDPDVWIAPTIAREDAVDFLDKRKSSRFNQKHNAILNAWIRVLLGSTDKNVEIAISAFDGVDETESPTFRVMSRSAFSRRLVA